MADVFDVIVVGAGSAGAALAGRLSEDEGRRVLLLEAGPDYRTADTPEEIRSIEPGAMQTAARLTGTHTFEHLLATRSSTQPPLPYIRGRGVGGSSAINGMFAIRATVEDFDGWAAAGCTGWDHESVLPLLRRMESDEQFGHEGHHGNSGPVPISRPRREDLTTVDAAVAEAAIELGHPWTPDHNAPGTTGISPYAYNGRAGVRVSTNDAYLEPARSRSNLVVLGDALVDRILFSGNRATGVRAIVDGRINDFHAAEVVVSGGAIHSPAILQRSGVGPADQLRTLGIAPVVSLPVGLHLQDHPGMAMLLTLPEPLDYGRAPQRGQLCLRFTTGVGSEVNDAMIAVTGSLGIGVPIGGLVGFGNRVVSTGSVLIASTDPSADPTVDLGLLSHPDDMRRFRLVVDEMQALAAHPALKAAVTSFGLGDGSVPAGTTMSDAEFEQFALAQVIDTVHASSSCRMGDPSDPDVVVDPRGRVLGTEGLRVADTSIFPWVTRANTNLTAILVGEKIADALKEDEA